jgi:REP element-mobilizing transposase RayT
VPYDPEQHHRRSIRYPTWDYAGPGWYVVTICSHARQPIFGDVVDGLVELNELGAIVERQWWETLTARQYVRLDVFVIMPNHLHGIVIIDEHDGNRDSPQVAVPHQQPRGPAP